MTDTVGVIGLGNMGSAFAENLVKSGFAVVGFDVDAGRTAAFQAAGGQPAASAGAVAERAEVVITSLPNAGALRAVVEELAASGASGNVVVETGTLPIPVKQEAADRLAGRMTVIDCPVSGTGTQARQGDVVVYGSGDRDAFERCVPALRGFSRAQHYVGDFGTGMRLKLIANLLVAVHNAAAAEAITLARRAGVDLDTVLEVIAAGAGTSRMFEVRGPVIAAGTYDDATATVDLFKKDLGLITEFAREVDAPVPLLALTAQLYAAAEAQGRGRQDAAAIGGVLAGLAGLPERRDGAGA